MDRVDLRVELQPVRTTAFTAEDSEPTAAVQQRVAAARAAAAHRWAAHGITTNAEVSGVLLRRRYRLSAHAMTPLRAALDRGALSIRGVDRSLRVAWTLADLAGRTMPDQDDVATALSFRQPGSDGERRRCAAAGVGLPVAGGRAALGGAGRVGLRGRTGLGG